MRGREIFPPAQEFGKRSDVSRILMPTAPTRIKSLLRATRANATVIFGLYEACLPRYPHFTRLGKLA